MTTDLSHRGDVAVLVPAAGAGVRLGAGLPKALCPLRGESLLAHAVRRIAAASSVGVIVVAAPPGQSLAVAELLDSGPTRLIVVDGGANRQDSVAAALAAVPDGYGIVLVHDAARALTPSILFDQVAAAVRGGHKAVVPVLPVVDTIKQVDSGGTVLHTVDRSALRAAQTPQGFRREVLTAAHAAASHSAANGPGGSGPAGSGSSATDDAGMVERLGVPVHTVPGDPAALKVTNPLDLRIAELLLDALT